MEHEIDLEEMGRQLRCPSGAWAAEVGDMMFLSNGNMINRTVEALAIRPGDSILEIGFGSGRHLPDLFARYPDIVYHGADISDAMLDTASAHNRILVDDGRASFHKVSGDGTLDFADSAFDRCFTVNTLYFWDDPAYYLSEIRRTLHPGGRLALAFIDKQFGEQLPFTRQVFTFYETEQVAQLFREAGFESVEVTRHTEETFTKDGRQVTRPFAIATGTGPS